jgi:hypothetical protein
MKRFCLVLAVMALASIAASATNINVSFDGYCDVLEFTLSGTPKVYLDGVHDYSACSGLPSVYVGGFQHTIPGFGSWFDLMDPTLGYLEGLPYGFEILTSDNLKKPCTWAAYIDFPGGYDVLDNAGTCSFSTPDALRPTGLPVSFRLPKK